MLVIHIWKNFELDIKVLLEISKVAIVSSINILKSHEKQINLNIMD